jgi:hypothetical protein
MDDSRKFFHYHSRWTPDRKIQVYPGSGWSFNDHLFILCGTTNADTQKSHYKDTKSTKKTITLFPFVFFVPLWWTTC